MGSYRIFWLGLALSALVILTTAATLNAQSVVSITVTTTADDFVVNGNCTLREAIVAANTDTAVDACAAGSGADTIVVPAGVYVLSLTGPGEDAAFSGDLDIVGQVTIRGAGAAATIIDGGWMDPSTLDLYDLLDRVLHVLPGGNVTLSGVTVQGGACWAGGGIFNAGRLVIADSVVRSNWMTWNAAWCSSGDVVAEGGAGIYNAGDLLISQSRVTGNAVRILGFETLTGGGLANSGTARIEMSALLGNTGANAGGVLNLGDLSVSDSEIGYNVARFHGGGLWNSATATLTRTTVSYNADGGGIVSVGPGLTLINSTVAHNVAYHGDGAGITSDDGGELVSSTIAYNGGETYGPGIVGPLRLRNTIVAGNHAGDCGSSVVSLGRNLDSDGSCGLNGPGDLRTDPLLQSLTDNGGPVATVALSAGSPAIDRIAAADCGTTTDQRGVRRPQGSLFRCDIGAYEFSPSADVGLTIAKVKSFYQRGLLTNQQERPLLVPLKTAGLAVLQPDLPGACRALGDFSSLVTAYLQSGLAADVGQSLLSDSRRIKAILCFEE